MALQAFDDALARDDRRAYLVLPPGAGKTRVGLEAAAQTGRRTLVLTPNTAVHQQWLDQHHQYIDPAGTDAASATGDLAATVTVLTYQRLTVWDRASPDPDSGSGSGMGVGVAVAVAVGVGVGVGLTVIRERARGCLHCRGPAVLRLVTWPDLRTCSGCCTRTPVTCSRAPPTWARGPSCSTSATTSSRPGGAGPRLHPGAW